MTAETSEDTVIRKIDYIENDTEIIDESWALMLLIDSEIDSISDPTQPKKTPKTNHNTEKKAVLLTKTETTTSSIKVEDEIITVSPQKSKLKSHLSAIETQTLNFEKSKPKNSIKKRALPSFRAILGL